MPARRKTKKSAPARKPAKATTAPQPPGFQLTSVHPLTDFKRHTTAFRKRLKATGRPEVLTVDGRADLVVQDAAAYQKLLDEVERMGATAGILRGIEAMRQGPGRPASEFFDELQRKYRVPEPA